MPTLRLGRSAVLAGACVIVGPSTVAGQEPAELPPGSRVRVTAPPTVPVATVGTVAGWRPDSLLLDAPGRGQLALPLPSVRRLEVRRGDRSNVAIGGLVGLAVGGAAEAALVAAFCGPDSACTSDDVVESVALVALSAMLLGGGLGALIRTERWERVPLSRLSVEHGGGRAVRFGIAWNF
ncbi:MAG: hypothetical protein ACRELC_09440 [Gemmatimonadota bacterium]